MGSMLVWEPLEFWNSHYSSTTTLWCKSHHYCFMNKKWACSEGSIHIWWRAPSLFCGRCTHVSGVSVPGHSGRIFRVGEVCGMVCNMKTVVFESQSMDVVKHVYAVRCKFYSYWEMLSGSSVACRHMKWILMKFCILLLCDTWKLNMHFKCYFF